MSNATVSVSNNVVSVSIDPIRAGTSQNINIEWDIDNGSSAWTFTSTGIVVTGGDGVFTDPELKSNGKKFKWKDKNAAYASYKYTINVTDGTTTLSLDPTIQNQSAGLS